MEEIFHVFNRGVEKRDIFLDTADYLRFIVCLVVCNSKQSVRPLNAYTKIRVARDVTAEALEKLLLELKSFEDRLVEILAFCLMSNHFHLMVRPLVENGLALFMQKLGTGFTLFFNKKYDRVGSLFQGTYKSILVDDDSYLMHLPFYIHLNALDLIEPRWREGEIKNLNKSIKFLDNYLWSSHRDYAGEINFPNVIHKEGLKEIIGSPDVYKKDLFEYLMGSRSLGGLTSQQVDFR